ncbi:hypothetical protein CNMCM5793_000749 [Aspergillus hiratsukae]|uniref:Catalase core domain-containing protein n=1 Tax=Aspergillus hiratsukae TaxID=1194566 RepID=A0A8H6P0S2_9EURO|nr:hypothetical protein CNMCM5793_000749 [Aspergillus hiratsukae]KAF7166120.1 hypothetical protein CNMCM6106_002078 [Aspergillus hiratsukae]
MQQMANTDRNRVVHAKGSGAYGEFEVTHDVTNYTSLAFLNQVGKKTPLFSRFSTVAGEKGSADNVRDSRGFAFKLYTEEGNLDWLFFGSTVFPIRDAAKFPSMIHAQKRDPASNLLNSTHVSFFNRNPEGYNFLMRLFSDQGTPWSYRYTDIHSINTYRFTKPDGSFHYVRISLKTDQGVRNLTQPQMLSLIGTDPDFATRDLYSAIEKGNYPSWTVSMQLIDPNKVHPSVEPILFDSTKELPQDIYPLIPFGKITLNRNPVDYFAEVEQSTFQVANLVPGWDVSADPILQVRLFPYGDTQRYRVGINAPQLPVNRPFHAYNPTRRDGAYSGIQPKGLPNYFPSIEAPNIVKPKQSRSGEGKTEPMQNIVNFQSQVQDEDFEQPAEWWSKLATLGEDQQGNLVYNVASSLSGAVEVVRNDAYAVFERIDGGLADAIKNKTEEFVHKQMEDDGPFYLVMEHIAESGYRSRASGGSIALTLSLDLARYGSRNIPQQVNASLTLYSMNTNDTRRAAENMLSILKVLGSSTIRFSLPSRCLPKVSDVLRTGPDILPTNYGIITWFRAARTIPDGTGPGDLLLTSNLGGNVTADSEKKHMDTSMHPARQKAAHLINFVRSVSIPTAHEKARSLEELHGVQMRKLYNIEPCFRVSYRNLGDPRESDAPRVYWGPNYRRLLEIDRRWDPEDLFFSQLGVGSEGWAEVQMCKRQRTLHDLMSSIAQWLYR